ncbi:DNA-binding protein [Paenibacillus thiaminolyticus]|uniref:DNA-binding protein n=1 Tax=Paenibacillus thiaminolyticus TaxID=49283 RepID=UPI00254336A5|nr:DNA-binding protein [Paenibacillus thiaminolyticus]WII36856.1 DNA-binding protein [Paenibacillus thiaminolyticus]
MLQVSLDLADDHFRQILREEIKSAISDVLRDKHISKFMDKPFLTRTEMMEVLHIGATKAAELMRRPDFPVCYEAGILIPTELLYKWVIRNTRWLEENSNYFGEAI